MIIFTWSKQYVHEEFINEISLMVYGFGPIWILRCNINRNLKVRD